jgi:glutamyl-tRNA synthetase
MPRGRFAPSPSGDLHLGGARTTLAAWLAARRDGGGFLLRIEDVDRPRVVPGAEERILEDLRWLGLDWDGEPVRQSERLPLYEQALRRLEGRGLVFPCFCSRADVAQAASAPHGPALAYPGTCRDLSPAEVKAKLAEGKKPSLRFRAPDRELCFDDAVHGRVCGRSDDFIVRRSDGLFAYQLAVVVDDIDMAIEEVVRGDDLLDSTPRQLLLYEALGAQPPRFAHVPLLLGPDGQRLSKRHGSIGVRAFREAGWSARRLTGWLAGTLGLCDGGAEVAPAELLASFSVERIAREPFTLRAQIHPSG